MLVVLRGWCVAKWQNCHSWFSDCRCRPWTMRNMLILISLLICRHFSGKTLCPRWHFLSIFFFVSYFILTEGTNWESDFSNGNRHRCTGSVRENRQRKKKPILIAIDARSETKRWIHNCRSFPFHSNFLIGVSLWLWLRRRNFQHVIISMPNSNKLHRINLSVI